MGAGRCRASDPGLCLRSRGPRLERKGARSPGRASAFGRRARPSCGCQCSRAICSRRSLGRRHICTRLRDGLSKGRGRGRAARLVHPVSVRSVGISELLLLVASCVGATSDARARGVARVYSFASFSSFPSDARRALRAFSSSPREFRADRDEFAELRTVFRQDKALTSLGGKPLFVLTADIGQLSGWPAAQKRLAGLSTNSVQKTAHGATHAALLEDRNYAAVSSRAIDAVVRSVRTSSPLAR